MFLINRPCRKRLCLLMAAFFCITCSMPGPVNGQPVFSLPSPGVRIGLSDAYAPVVMKGIEIIPENPFEFNFYVDIGEDELTEEEIKHESGKLIKYFLAALTVPGKDLWVNLSPLEKDRIIPEAFGETEMGRDLLGQDYLLKQITSSMMYPEEELGETFWSKVYEQAYEEFGVTDIDVKTFHKVWIVPQKAVVYEQGKSAFVIEQRLKVLVEEDYLALEAQIIRGGTIESETVDSSRMPLATRIVKEIIIPALEIEVNEGRNFAALRQIYHSLILATWFKRTLRETLLGDVYIGKNKIMGVDIDDKNVKEKIYRQYMEAFKKGVYDTIKEEYDPVARKVIGRKYASGGFFGRQIEEVFKKTPSLDSSQLDDFAMSVKKQRLKKITSQLDAKTTTADIHPFVENAVYSNARFEDGRIIGGKILNPQGSKDLRELQFVLRDVRQDFTGIIYLRLPATGRLSNILKNDLWNKWAEHGGKAVVLELKKGRATAVFTKEGQRLFPFDRNFIYPEATIDERGIIATEPANPDGYRLTTEVNAYLGQHPEFTGIIGHFFLDASGGLQKFHDRKIRWSSMAGYENRPVNIVMKEGRVIKVLDLEGKQIFPFGPNNVYINADFVNGEIQGGQTLFPQGAKTFKELKNLLNSKNMDKNFSGVVKAVLSSEGTLMNILGNDVWRKWGLFQNKPVTIIFKEGQVTAVFNEKKEKVFPFDRYFIYPEARYEPGQGIIKHAVVNPSGFRDLREMNHYLKNNPGFTGVLEKVFLNKRGGLTNFHDKKLTWEFWAGYENAPVTIIMKEGKVVQIRSESGQLLYPFQENVVYEGARFDKGKIAGGRLMTPAGIKGRSALNKFLSAYPLFSGVITDVPLNENGGLTYFAGKARVWDEKEGYENAIVTVVMENGLVMKAYDRKNKIIYERQRKQENIIYPNATFRNATIHGAEPLNPYGTLGRKELTGLLDSQGFSESFTGIIDKVRLDLNGGLLNFLGNDYWGGMSGHANQLVTIVMAQGTVSEIYDEKNTKIYPFKENFIYPGAEYEDGEIIGDPVNPQGAIDRSSIESYLNQSAEFSGVITTRLLSNGNIPKFLVSEDNAGKKYGDGYKPIIVIMEKGQTVNIYDEAGNQIFPSRENFVFHKADFVEGEIIGGTQIAPQGLGTRAALNNLLGKYPHFSGIISQVRLLKNGYLGRINGVLYREAINGYEDQLVTVRMDQGRVVAIYNDKGDPIWAEDKSTIGIEILNNLWKSGDFERLLNLFGEERTNRLLFHFFDDITPMQIVKFTQLRFGKVLDREKRKTQARQKKLPFEVVGQLSSIRLFQRQPADIEFQTILAQEIFSLIYFNMSQDYRYLEKIEQEIEENQFNGLLRKAFLEVVEIYKTLKDFEIAGIRTTTQLKFYQKFGIKTILQDKRVLLADKPGLGKTLQALGAAVNAYDGKGAQKVFIICPSVSIDNTWIRDIEKHLKGEQKVFVIKSRKDFEAPKKWAEAQNARFIIANYEILRGESAQALRNRIQELGIDFVIADEGHRMKNNSQLTDAVKYFDAEYKILISASAQQGRSIGKIFNLLHWLYPEVYPDRKTFLRTYRTSAGIKKLKAEFKGFMLRRHISDVLADLPALKIEVYPVDMGQEQAALYRQVEANYFEAAQKHARKQNWFGPFNNLIKAAVDTALIRDISFINTKTKQVHQLGAGKYYLTINGALCKMSFKQPAAPEVAYVDGSGQTRVSPLKDGGIIDINGEPFQISIKERDSHSAKYTALDNIVKDVVLQKSESLAVFTGSRKTLEDLKKRYESEGHIVLVIHGNIRQRRRKDILNTFNRSQKPMILISTYQTLGESVDITGARYGVLVDSPWIEREQIISRLYRLGQTQDVHFIVLLAKNTIDEHVEKVNWMSDMIKSIVLDDGFYPEADNEMAKDFIQNITREKENLVQLKAFQDKVRQLNEAQARNAQKAVGRSTEIADGHYRVNFFNEQFDAELTDKDQLMVYINGIGELLSKSSSLSAESKKILSRFFSERFHEEHARNYRVKDMLLWHIGNEFIPGFRHIDYDGNLEFMIEIGTYVLKQLISHPEIDEITLKAQMKDVPERLYNQTMYYLDTSNILKLFSLLGVIPETYYYEGKLLNYENTISINYLNGRIRYWDKQIVENIAPGWKIHDAKIPPSLEGPEDDTPYVRVLEEAEIKRLANQVRLGNKSAEKVLVLSHVKQLQRIAKRVIYGGRLEKVFGNRITGTVTIESLVSFGQEELIMLINEYADKEIYYNKSLKEYLRENLNPHIYSQAFRLAREYFLLEGDKSAYSNEQRTGPTVLDLQSEDAVGSSRLEFLEFQNNFRDLLAKEGFSPMEVNLLVMYAAENYSKDELAAEYAQQLQPGSPEESLEFIEVLLNRFFTFMFSLGEEKARTLLEEGLAEKKPQSGIPADKEVGGIDLNAQGLRIETHGAGLESGYFHEEAALCHGPDFTGFAPVIINIVPVTSLSHVLSVY